MKNITSLFITAIFISFFSINTTFAAPANLALGKLISAKVKDMNGGSSNNKDAGLMADGDVNTAWESADSYKHSILIDLGSKFRVTKIVVKWADEQAANTVTLNFGETKETMMNISTRKDLTEKVESIYEGFNEEARFVEVLLHGRMDSSKPYKISEIEVYGEENLALLKPVSARVTSMTGKPSNQEIAHLLNDGDFDTYWESPESSKHSILIDLGEKKKITRVVVKWADGCASGSIDLSFGEKTENMIKVWSRNQLTETIESVFDNLDEEARFFEFMVRGRLLTTYRIREIEIYDDNANKHVNTPEEQASIDKITERLMADILSGSPDESGATTFSNTMLEDGSWPDVDYSDEISIGTWSPMSHLNRLRVMAIAYRHPESTLKDDASLLAKIEKGLLFFKARLPKSTDNWWYNEIGAPQVYMIPVLLIKGKIAENNMRAVSSYLKDKIDNYLGEAKNLTWIANIALHKGCAEDNFSIVEHSFDAFFSTLSIVSEQGKEGIKADWSFHQHHSQLYSGGYGMSFISDIIKTYGLCEGTLFTNRLVPEKLEIFRNLLLEGNLLLSYRHVIDFGTMGRNISRSSNTSYTTVSEADLEKMIIIDPEYTPTYQAWLAHIRSSAPFPKAGVNKHFWKSDIMTKHGANYYLSAKIISERTYGAEALNGENIKGFNLPLGSTNIMTTGYEYDRIFPVWDWTRIPGTTAVQDQDSTALDGYIIGSNKFGGGVSNGSDGIIAYDHDNRGLKTKKSYFFFDDMMFCMGNGITFGEDKPVATSVNQSYLSGDVVIDNGSEQTLEEQSEQDFNNLKWVHHDNVGYIFPKNVNIHVQNKEQTGSWRDINSTGSTTSISKDIFSVWFDHGQAPLNSDYQYIVVPDVSLDGIRNIAVTHGFVVSHSDTIIQAIRKDNKYGIIFYEPGAVTMDDGLIVTSDKSAAVMIIREDGKYDISVADPTYSQKKITLTINEELKPAMYFAVEEKISTLEFTLPSGDYTGSSITNSYIKPGVGIGENKNQSSSYVYYDRAQAEVKVNIGEEKYTRLDILDMNGRIIAERSISSTQTDANISLINCPAGIYFVRLSGINNVEILKFIIAR